MAKTTIEIDDKVLKEMVANLTTDNVKPWLIHDGVEYGVFQEFGKNGHPSLVPAFERVTKKLPDAIGEAVEKAINLNDILEKAARDIQKLWAQDVNVDTGAYKNSIRAKEGDVGNLT